MQMNTCSSRYYDDAACVLRDILIMGCAPHMYSPLPSKLPWADREGAVAVEESHGQQQSGGYGRAGGSLHQGSSLHLLGQREQLRCVIAIIRQ